VKLFDRYRKILLDKNPNLTKEEIDKILEFIELLAKQTVKNYKK
jgi:hypothetical protein